MKVSSVDRYQKGLATTLLLLPLAQVSAQDDDDFFDEPVGRSSRWVEDEDYEMMDEEGPVIDLRYYMGELLGLFFLIVIVFLVNHFSSKRNRTGCVFFTILIIVVGYFFMRYV